MALTLVSLAASPAAAAATAGSGPAPAADSDRDDDMAFDAPETPEPGWTRRSSAIVAATGAIHGGFALWTWAVWYRNQTQSPTFLWQREGFFGAETYAGGADKAGHFTGNYVLTRATAQLLGAAGLRDAPRLLIAFGLTFGSFLAVELKDAYHARFGFSWEDMVANLGGNAVAIAMELWPALDRAVDLRFAYAPSPAYAARLGGEERNVGEDYDGMRFELLVKCAAFVPPPPQTRPALRGLRYLALGLGFATRGYKPVRVADPRQELRMIVAFDVQTFLDDVVYDRTPGVGRPLLRFASEHLAMPWTSWSAPLWSR